MNWHQSTLTQYLVGLLTMVVGTGLLIMSMYASWSFLTVHYEELDQKNRISSSENQIQQTVIDSKKQHIKQLQDQIASYTSSNRLTKANELGKELMKLENELLELSKHLNLNNDPQHHTSSMVRSFIILLFSVLPDISAILLFLIVGWKRLSKEEKDFCVSLDAVGRRNNNALIKSEINRKDQNLLNNDFDVRQEQVNVDDVISPMTRLNIVPANMTTFKSPSCVKLDAVGSRKINHASTLTPKKPLKINTTTPSSFSDEKAADDETKAGGRNLILVKQWRAEIDKPLDAVDRRKNNEQTGGKKSETLSCVTLDALSSRKINLASTLPPKKPSNSDCNSASNVFGGKSADGRAETMLSSSMRRIYGRIQSGAYEPSIEFVAKAEKKGKRAVAAMFDELTRLGML